MVACDFCGQRLSTKHLRSLICNNFAVGPTSVRCITDGLVLCHECYWDAHGSCTVSSAHDRCPVKGFMGCPSTLDLAATWGLEIEDKGAPPSYEWAGLLEELMITKLGK